MKRLVLIASIMVILPIQTMAESITLNQVIHDSLQKNASLIRVQRELEDKLATAAEAQVLDNPELNIDAIRASGDDGLGADIEITQPLKYSHLSGARSAYAQALSKVANAEQQYEMLKVINETTALYMQAWLLNERKNIYANYADDAEKMKKLVSAAAGQGQTSPAASHLFSADAAKLRADAHAIAADLQRARTDLARLTGRSFQSVNLERPLFATVPQDSQKLLSFAQSQFNLRNVTTSRMDAAKQRLSVAKQDAALPEIGPRLVYSRSPEGDEQSYGIGLTLRVPLWNRNDAERKRANAELRQVNAETDLWGNLPQKEMIVALQHSATALQNRADRYFDSILPRYRKAYELTAAMFRQGQADALQVWQVREKLLTCENEALDALAEAVNARGALEMELGGKLEQVQ